MRVKVKTVLYVAWACLIVALCAELARPQTTINGQRIIVSDTTVQGATTLTGTTKTVNFEASLPGTCTAPSGSTPGEMVFRTSDNTLHACTATDTFTQIGGGGGGGTIELMTYADAVAETCDGGATGTIIFLTGSIYQYVRCNGSSWIPFRNGLECTPPVFGDFTRVNAGSETTSTTNGGTLISFPATSTSFSPKLWTKAEPSAPYTITIGASVMATAQDFNMPLMLGWRNSSNSDQQLHASVWCSSCFGGWGYLSSFADSPTVEVSNQYLILSDGTVFDDIFIRISVDSAGTPHRHVSYSHTGLEGSFVELYDVTHTTLLTPNEVIFGGQARQANFAVKTWVFHWKETSP